MEILRVENVCKTYHTGETTVNALTDISFSVQKGEFVAIIGASGSGKSTLLHILGGIDRPTSGEVFVDGQSVYEQTEDQLAVFRSCLLYTSPSPRDKRQSRMPSSA